MAGYIRQDVGNNIENDEIADATYLDQEFDAMEGAMNASTGHTHGGDVGEGGPILVIGPVQNFIASSTVFRPKVTDTYDLGTSTFKFKDLYISGNVSAGSGLTGYFRASSSGTVSLPSYTFEGDPDTGMYRSAANQLTLVTQGFGRLTIAPSGNTTIVQDLSVGGALTVTGTITGDSFSGDIAATSITSGTLNSSRLTGSYTGITGTGALNAGSITSGFGSINIGGDTINSGPITSTGTITSLQNFASSTDNVVLANNGAGGVYLRPNGVASSSGQLLVAGSGNVSIAGDLTVTGSISGTLAAADLTGTIASARLSGSYTGITTVGNLTGLTAGNIEIDGNEIFNEASDIAYIRISGGGTANTGGNIELFGSTHATVPSEIRYDGATHTFRTTAGSNLAILSATGLSLGANVDIEFNGTGAATTRTNLGLGSMAVLESGTGTGDFRTNSQNDSRFMIASNNLSQLTNLSTARTNLGLGSMSTLDSGTAGTEFRNNTQNDARFHNSGTDTLAAGDLPTGSTATTWIRTEYAGVTVNQVGTYAMLRNDSGSSYDQGEDAPAANLSYAYTSGTSGDSPTGTWKCMGYGPAGTVTMWLKVA